MNKIFVTGAGGVLGANIVHELCQRGYEVSVFVRKNTDISAIKHLPIQKIYGDICNKHTLKDAVAGHDGVIHAAAITAQWGVSFDTYEKVNVGAVQSLVEACKAHQIKRFILVSTANTMGAGSLDDPGSELNGFTFFKARSGYINSKYLAQQYVLEQVARFQFPAVIVNPAFILGAYDQKPSSGQIILIGNKKRILWYPPGGKNFVHAADAASATVNALQRGTIGDCYLLAGENLSYRDFFKKLQQHQGLHAIMIRIPKWLLHTASIANTILATIFHRQAKLNYTAAYMLCRHNYYSGKKSERELGIIYQSAEQAIATACQYFTQRGLLK